MRKQAERFRLEFRSQEVQELKPAEPVLTLVSEDGQLTASAVIIANRACYRRSGAPGEDRLSGKGVSFCTTCDGRELLGKTEARVGYGK